MGTFWTNETLRSQKSHGGKPVEICSRVAFWFQEFDSKGLLDVFLAPMKSRSFWLFGAIAFLALLILASSLSAAVPAKKIRLAYSAFAYANPPFWIA